MGLIVDMGSGSLRKTASWRKISKKSAPGIYTRYFFFDIIHCLTLFYRDLKVAAPQLVASINIQ